MRVCRYGCGGLMAMRAGLRNQEKPNPPQVINAKGAKAFGSLPIALGYLQKLDGLGLVVAVERRMERDPVTGEETARPWFTEDNPRKVIGRDYVAPATNVHIALAKNFRTLLGTPDNWYWEDATDTWSDGGDVRHTQGPLSSAVFIVVPGAPTQSPIPTDLLKEPSSPEGED